jgi:gamma-glutamylcyclotransferase (GGCT)/AIG2-like uncharacterized protein YtfP
MESLFVYGTLRNQRVQKKAMGRAVKGVPGVLAGFKKTRVKIGDEFYPVIKKSPKSSVKGLVLLVTRKELHLLDDWESENYERRKVRLRSGKTAWVYRRPED